MKIGRPDAQSTPMVRPKNSGLEVKRVVSVVSHGVLLQEGVQLQIPTTNPHQHSGCLNAPWQLDHH